MAKPRTKKKKVDGLSPDERLTEALPFPAKPGGTAVPGEGPGEALPMNPISVSRITSEAADAPLPLPLPDVACPRAAFCAVADSTCLTENHCGPRGAFTRQTTAPAAEQPPQTGSSVAQPAPISTPGTVQVLDLHDTRKVLDLMYAARARREASEPRPAPRHWNGINFRRNY